MSNTEHLLNDKLEARTSKKRQREEEKGKVHSKKKKGQGNGDPLRGEMNKSLPPQLGFWLSRLLQGRRAIP